MTGEFLIMTISMIISAASVMGYVRANIIHLNQRINELSDVRERLARIEAKLDNIKHG